jgi:hypothetical protein
LIFRHVRALDEPARDLPTLPPLAPLAPPRR